MATRRTEGVPAEEDDEIGPGDEALTTAVQTNAGPIRPTEETERVFGAIQERRHVLRRIGRV